MHFDGELLTDPNTDTAHDDSDPSYLPSSLIQHHQQQITRHRINAAVLTKFLPTATNPFLAYNKTPSTADLEPRRENQPCSRRNTSSFPCLSEYSMMTP